MLPHFFSSLLFFAIAQSGLAVTGEISVLPMAPGDSTPFVVRLTAQELTPDDLYTAKVWVYDRDLHKAISRIWTEQGWKTGWFGWQEFLADTSSKWASWIVLKIHEPPGPTADYYIKYKLASELGDTCEVQIERSEGFQILDMPTEGGWLEGVVYSDPNFQNPYEEVILLAGDSSDSILGGYLSENNEIEEGYPADSGYFLVGVRAGEISAFDCRNLAGDSVTGYFELPSPWIVEAGETTFVSVTCDLAILDPMVFAPERPEPGADLQISTEVFNRGNIAVGDFRVFSFADENYNSLVDPGEGLDEKLGLELAPLETLGVSLIWQDVPEGIHSIFIQVEAQGDEHPENDQVSRSLRVGSPLGDLVLNELMYHPLSGQTEWIEVYNRTPYQIEMENWSIEDQDTLHPKPFSSTPIPSGGFLLLVSDSSTFNIYHPEVACPFLTPEGGLPSLNDAGDRATLRNSDGVLVDGVAYDPGWGGGRGVSLEKINHDQPSDEPSNWGSCVSYTGGTPGEANSIYTRVIPAKESLQCSPRVFSPDGDGVNDRVAISYELPVPKAKVKLVIYDRVGRRVKALLDQEDSGAKRTIFWDGKDDDDQTLPIGIYIVYLQAVSGREVITSKKTVVLAKRLR